MRRPAAGALPLLVAAVLAALPAASRAAEGAGATAVEWSSDLLLAGALIGVGTLASLAVAAAAMLAARRAPQSEPEGPADHDRLALRARARSRLDDDPIMAAMGLGDDEERPPRRRPPPVD